MSSETPLFDELTSTRDGLLLWCKERTLLDITELASVLMKRESVSRKELARRMGIKPRHLTRILDGSCNPALSVVSNMFACLGYQFRASFERLSDKEVKVVSE